MIVKKSQFQDNYANSLSTKNKSKMCVKSVSIKLYINIDCRNLWNSGNHQLQLNVAEENILLATDSKSSIHPKRKFYPKNPIIQKI